MRYEKLSKIFYAQGSSAHETEYEKRFNDYASYRTGLTIHPFRKGNALNQETELFFVNIHPLMKLYEQVLENSKSIQLAVDKLPHFAVEPYFRKLIINEAQSNNEIEGVRSTKEELSNVLEHIHDTKITSPKRFLGMMKTYHYIDHLKPFVKIEDFRKLYDEFVADEVSKDKVPDGEYFRKTGFTITDGTKITHRGIEPEAKIIDKLNGLIHFLQMDEMPDLYKYFIAHYYYEFIHPFYDGNGRTGRLVVCSYVSRKLERYSAITLSYSINNDKKKYYQALETIANPFNRGDMTFYLMDMLELLIAGQQSIIEDLQMVLAKSERIETYVENIDWSTDKVLKNILYIMLYTMALSDREAPLSNRQLMEIMDLSKHRINKIMDELEAREIVELIRKRPKTFTIQEHFMDSIFES